MFINSYNSGFGCLVYQSVSHDYYYMYAWLKFVITLAMFLFHACFSIAAAYMDEGVMKYHYVRLTARRFFWSNHVEHTFRAFTEYLPIWKEHQWLSSVNKNGLIWRSVLGTFWMGIRVSPKLLKSNWSIKCSNCLFHSMFCTMAQLKDHYIVPIHLKQLYGTFHFIFYTLLPSTTTPPLIKFFVYIGESWFAGRNSKVFIA